MSNLHILSVLLDMQSTLYSYGRPAWAHQVSGWLYQLSFELGWQSPPPTFHTYLTALPSNTSYFEIDFHSMQSGSTATTDEMPGPPPPSPVDQKPPNLILADSDWEDIIRILDLPIPGSADAPIIIE